MSQKNAKGKSGKTRKAGADQSVLGSLPSTRPARIGRRREGTPAANGSAKPAATAAKPKTTTTTARSAPAAAKLRAPPRPAAAKPVAATAKPRPAAAKPAAADGPRAVRSGSPSLKRPAPSSPSRRERRSGPPKGTELVTTAVQAAGELAQIGASMSARMVKRAVDRLPKP